MLKFRFLPCVFALSILTSALESWAATNLTPIAATGFNRDVVVEAGSAGPPFVTALNFNAGEGTAFYQSGLSGKSFGLPASGAVTNATDSTAYQLQPYTASNALVLSADTGLTSGTLTLAAPAIYSRIALIANSGNGDATGLGSLTLRFNDNSTVTTNYYAPDWFNNNATPLYAVALQGFERITLSSGGVSGNPGNPRFYQTTINVFSLVPGGNNKPLSSITFAKATGNSTGIYALSGLPAASVLLPSVTNTAASSILATSATLGGQVLSTGGEIPWVLIYYGTNNGGVNPGAWSNSVALGYQSGSFSQNLTGLAQNKLYYYTCRATNAAGSVVVSPSSSFTTATASAPAVTNLPATSVTAFTAALNGQVLSAGGDTPTITLFYGLSNGGTNPVLWDQSAALGLQSAAFSKTVLGLSSNTTYFYTFRAQNAFGATWASPSRAVTTTSTVPGPAAILTQHNDNSRTGDNLKESILNVGNVNTNTFGLLYTRSVDDQIYAQPLIATNVSVPGKGIHNLLLVATVNDSIYAFDADDSTVTAAYWQTNLTGVFGSVTAVAPRNTDMTGACGGGYIDFSGAMGIVGTPVVDPATGIMYFVARTRETVGATTNFVQRLYALDVATGTNRIAPVVISGSYGGVTFDPQRNNQRAGLTLANNTIYIAWSSHCDWGPYHGWVMAYNAGTLAQTAVYADTPTGSNGGIWMSGQGPAADPSGNIYLSTGNGTVGVSGNASDPTNRAMSFLKLNGTSLAIMSWFSPYNWSFLNGGDWDLGAGGLMLIPGTSLAMGGGKSSTTVSANLYVVNRDTMGGVSSGTSDTNIVQAIPVTPTGQGVNHIHGAPVWWDAADGSYSYVWGEGDHLHQYRFDRVNGVFQLPAVSLSPTPAWVGGMTGGMLAVSASGTNAGTGILWASHQFTGDANQAVRPGIVHAYDAQNVSVELWNSEMISARDSIGKYAKFVPPTVANGKVYMATFSNRLNVYGLLPKAKAVVYQQPQTTTRFSGDPFTVSVGAYGASPLAYQWYVNGAAIPGATVPNYSIGQLAFQQAGTYICVLSNSFGSVTSAPASLTVAVASTVSYPQTVIADSPIAYWRLDETNGTVAHDCWGGHDGQYFSASLGQPGYHSNDADTSAGFGILASSDSYAGNITGIDFGTFANDAVFSVEAWVNGGTQASGAGIVTYGYGSGGEQFNLDTGSGSSKFRFSVRDAVNVAHNANSAVGPNSTWQHVVGVCDEPHGQIHLYVNGVDVADATISGGVQAGTVPISIGSRQSSFRPGNNLNFVGAIDEVAIYNYALSAVQVLNHYATGTNPVARLYVTLSGGNAVLTWSPGTLQSAPKVDGPYTTVPGATAPYSIPPTNSALFFKVKLN
jgi:hypothetical protein